MSHLDASLDQVQSTTWGPQRFGKIQSVVGLLVEAEGLDAAVGELCYIHTPDGPNGSRIKAEVVGVREGTTVLMPLERTVGLSAGCLVRRSDLPLTIGVGDELLGRVVDAHVNPIDDKGPLSLPDEQPVHQDPPDPLDRDIIDTKMPTGIRAIDSFLTLGRGQRVGIFAGSGVGKSTLLGMIARNAEADVNVVALIGERGREVREFISDSLGPEGLARSVVLAVTGDQAAMSRVKGASAALAVAEYFRDQGKDVLLMMDSVTRVAMAQREIGLAIGEPPTTRGYTPSVFALLPRLLERAGPAGTGSITGIFTVLVEGDDMNEPVSDAVRGTLDGHIVLSRDLAQANHFPAIDVRHSVSRLMPRITSEEEREAANEAQELISAYKQVEDLVNVGAYERGSDPETDRAIDAYPKIADFLQQDIDEAAEGNPSEKLRQLIESL